MTNEEKIEVYETISDSSFSEDILPVIESDPEIVTDIVSREDAVNEILNRTDETLSERVARIRREIEEIRNEAPPELLSELRAALQQPVEISRHKSKGTSETDPSSDEERLSYAIEASQEFAELETRVAQIESRLGASFRNQNFQTSVFDSIATIQSSLDLLSSDPDNVQQRIRNLIASKRVPHSESNSTSEDLVDPTRAKIDWIYGRLRLLDQQIRLMPQIVSRLQTLRFFHAETLQANEQVKSMDSTLANMQNEMQEWKAVLEKLASVNRHDDNNNNNNNNNNK